MNLHCIAISGLLFILWVIYINSSMFLWVHMVWSSLKAHAKSAFMDLHMFASLFTTIAWILTVLNLAGMVEIVSISSTYTLVLFLALLVLVSLGLVSAYYTGTRSLLVFVMTSQVIIGMVAFGILEVTSHLFRTISLSFRLFANILAGHLILHLVFGLCVYTIYVSALGTTAATLLLLALIGLECVMAIIQVYVFTMLSTVYTQEL